MLDSALRPFRALNRYLLAAGLAILAAIALAATMVARGASGGVAIIIIPTVLIVRLLLRASGRRIRTRALRRG